MALIRRASLQGTVRRMLERYRSSQQRRTMSLVVRELETRLGRPCPRSQRIAAREYAIEVLGDERHTEGLLVYSVIAGEFREGWIPWDYFAKVVAPSVNGRMRYAAKIKTLSRRLFRSNAFPDVAYVINGAYYDIDWNRLSHAELRQRIVSEDGSDVLVCKPDVSYAGRGVHEVVATTVDLEALAQALGNGVLQRRIVQHAFFDEFVPGGTVTLRIITASDPNRAVAARAAHVKFHRTTERVVGAATSVRCAVDPSSGIMSDVGFMKDWTSHDRHPDSGARFVTTAVPGFDSAVQLCADLHRGVPHVGVVGWDVMIDADLTPHVLEWNGYSPVISNVEPVSGPCFVGLGWESLWRGVG